MINVQQIKDIDEVCQQMRKSQPEEMPTGLEGNYQEIKIAILKRKIESDFQIA